MIVDRWKRALCVGAVGAVLTLGLAGCGGGPTDLNASTAGRLQAEVATIAELAAAGDTAGALATTDSLYTHLTAALEAGTVSTARADRIRAALDLVRQDLTTLLQPAAPEPEQTEPAEQPAGGDDSGPGTEQTGNSGGGNGNEGPGKNNGNGPGENNGNGPKDKDEKGPGKE